MTLRAAPPNRSSRDVNLLSDACSIRLTDAYESRGMIAAPIPLPIMEVEQEAEGIVTLWVQVPHSMGLEYRSGQYYMCWNPYDAIGGMNRPNYHSEKPYSVGDIRITPERTLLGFTVKDLGRQSGELTRLNVGDWLAIRGPFGTNFPSMSAGERLILVSGGIGSTPMHMAARDARCILGDNIRIDAVMGFQNSSESHYIPRMEKICDSLQVYTNDGSLGTAGFPTDNLPDLLEDHHDGRTVLFTCGPEQMMKPVLQIAVNSQIECYAAMERYLPCSVAVCGLCMVGNRLTCRDGPIMDGIWLLHQEDFGLPDSH